MKNLLKITLTLLIGIVISVGIFRPDMLMGTPASPAVGNWYQQFLPNIGSRSLQDIFFLDSLTGWAVTNKSTTDTMFVLKTSNAGDSWSIHFRKVQTGGGTPGYNRVYFLNQNTGYVSYTLGFDKTTDGGANWVSLRTGESFQDMSVLNNDTIWLVSGNPLTGGVFFTSNGGQNWVQQYSAGSQNPEKIYMYNSRIGFISDNSGSPSIRKTTNGGLNWNLNVSGQWYFDITFADSLTGWYSAASNIYKTTNGGNNWVLQNVPSGPDLLNLGINKLSLLNKDTLWAAGNAVFYPNSQVRAILLRTTNSGANWQYQIPDTAINNFLYYHLQFINKNNGWAYTTLRGIHTTTGGDPVWITAIEQTSSEIPKDFKLYQNYPNPFNPKTNIKYSIKSRQGGTSSQTSNVKLIVFDIQGKHLAEIVDQKQNAGTYEVDFDGSKYSSGIYFYKLTVTTGKEVFTETKRMVLIK